MKQAKYGTMDEAGSVTLEFSLLYTMLLGLILTIVHFGLLYHTSLTLADAADVGLEHIQSSEATSVKNIVDELIGDTPLVNNLETSVEIVESNARVSVSGNSPQIIWGLPNRITRQASGPLEQFLSEAER